MTRWYQLLFVAGALSFVAADWPQFRGPGGASVSSDSNVPTTWNVKPNEQQNVAWRTELPGRGPSSPIIVGDRVYVTCSGGVKQDRLYVVCYDAKSGKEKFRREFWATGRTLSHPQSANAAPTPACDGQRIYAFYSSNDLACLDLDGNLLWYRGLAHDYPKAGNDVGMSASPVVSGNTVVVQVESYGDSFAAGLDVQTGETRWRLDRKQAPNWCSPTVLRGKDGQEVVLLQSSNALTAHDPLTGRQVWQYEANCASIPSSVGIDGRVYLPANGITALDLSEGTAPKLLWDSNSLNPSAASPIIHDGKIYTLNGTGVLTCADVKDGKSLWQLRIGGKFWGTPVLAGKHMVCVNQDGKAKVVLLGEGKGEVVGESDFGELIQASPAIAGNAVYVRSDKHLWKISAEK